MPQQRAGNKVLEDALLRIVVQDFLGGLNSETDPGDLPPNTSPDCENVRFGPGRVYGRNGYVVRTSGLPAVADGIAFFYDRNNDRRVVIWANGNVYDVTDFSLTLVASSVYTAGYRITWTVLNSVLYFSDGFTIGSSGTDDSGIRYYDPYTSLVTAPLLISSGSVGSIETPACKVLTTKAGSLVLGNIKYVDGSLAPHAVMWTNVNDPTTVVGTNIFQLGQGQGGEINCLVPMGIANTGITPTDAIFVGKSQFGVYLLKGALSVSTLSEVLLNCPAGVLDGATAKWAPGPDGSGFVIFLGTDRRVWYSNAVSTGELSSPIRTEISNYIEDRFTATANPKFTSYSNDLHRHYVLDLGANTQYCYDWDWKCWTRYERWPSSYAVSARDSNSASVIYAVDLSSTRMVQLSAGTTDNGAAIEPYWTSAWLHDGDDDVLKIWHDIFVKYKTDTGNVIVTATANDGQGAASTVTLTPETQAGAGTWDSSLSQWDSAVWSDTVSTTYQIYKNKSRLPVSTSGLDGSKTLLRGYNCQVRLAQGTSGYFEVLGFQLGYNPRGRRRVA